MVEGCMMLYYQLIVSGSKLPESIKAMLSARDPCTIDELDEAFHELIYFLGHVDYYTTLDRIEKGEAFLAQQTEPAMIARCKARLNELAIELERYMPKEEAV